MISNPRCVCVCECACAHMHERECVCERECMCWDQSCSRETLGYWSLKITPTPLPLSLSLNLYQTFKASLLSGARGKSQSLRSPVGFIPTQGSGSSLSAGDQERTCAGCGFRGPGKLCLCPTPPDKGELGESLAQAPPYLSGPFPSTTPATTFSSLSITHLSPSASPHWA